MAFTNQKLQNYFGTEQYGKFCRLDNFLKTYSGENVTRQEMLVINAILNGYTDAWSIYEYLDEAILLTSIRRALCMLKAKKIIFESGVIKAKETNTNVTCFRMVDNLYGLENNTRGLKIRKEKSVKREIPLEEIQNIYIPEQNKFNEQEIIDYMNIDLTYKNNYMGEY